MRIWSVIDQRFDELILTVNSWATAVVVFLINS